MDLHDATEQLIDLQAQIFFACRARHVRDPQSGRVISGHQARILDHLDAMAPTSLTELAGRMGVTLATMSLAVDKLEHLALVRRDRDPDDRRRLQLTLTEGGVRMKAAHAVLDREQVNRVLARLSPLDRQRALQGLALLAEATRSVRGDVGQA